MSSEPFSPFVRRTKPRLRGRENAACEWNPVQIGAHVLRKVARTNSVTNSNVPQLVGSVCPASSATTD